MSDEYPVFGLEPLVSIAPLDLPSRYVPLFLLVRWADQSPAVTWTGRGGLKERILHPESFPDDVPPPEGVTSHADAWDAGRRAAIEMVRSYVNDEGYIDQHVTVDVAKIPNPYRKDTQ